MERYKELDSIRGLAAVTVIFCHFVVMLDSQMINYFGINDFVTNLFKFTPLSVFIAGHEAVVLFFVLSGLVLSLPFFNRNQFSYKEFIIKRIFRLYIPYISVIFFTLIVRLFINASKIYGFSNWFNEHWISPVSFSQVFNHILFLPSYTYGGGRYDIAAFNSVIWSLIQEMRISIIFPILMIVIIRYNWKVNVSIAAASSALYLCTTLVNKNMLPNVVVSLMPYTNTLEWLPMFIMGALIGKNLKPIQAYFTKFSSNQRMLVSLTGLLTYTYPHWMLPKIKVLHIDIINDWMTLFGASIFIVQATTSEVFARFLLTKAVHHIGKISYSLYLWHVVILLVLYHSLSQFVPLWGIWTAVFFISLIMGTLSYKYIELPSISLGRKVSKLLAEQTKHRIKTEKALQQSI